VRARARAVIGAGLLLAGCGLPGARRQAERTDLVARADTLARAGDFRTAEATYRRVVDAATHDAPADPVRDRALLGLGRLYVAPDNPERDYRQAYQHFDRLARERPDSPAAVEARAWRDLLASAQRQRDEAMRARQEAQRLRQELRRAREEIEAFRRDLDRLKRIELDLERQRR
jgi:tetratricopeptide (TPR) repeat protein